MNAEILTVGTELLLGDIVNSNSQFLSRELAVYGIDTLYQSTVGDNRERLESALALALSRCDMVILTGGLGPTEDDLTRETVAQALNLPLELHEESEKRIREYFHNTGKDYTENNRKQAMLPKGCTVFPNDHGTAPGCAVERYGQCVILLPGPPKELMPMFFNSVAPFLQRFSGETIRSHTVGVFGIPEAAVDEQLHDLMEGSNPTVAPYAKSGEVQLRVTAKAATAEEADALCLPVLDEIRDRLGAAVYGVDTDGLPEAVVALLKKREKKIATAESCTAGLLSGRLTEVPGVSQVFECGIAAYSPEIKRQVLGVPDEILENQGAVSPETAGAMATGARRVGGADIGIGITGVAGPDPSEGKEVGTVYVALADERRVWVKKVFAGHGTEDREQIRNAATLYALDMARRYLEALPGVMAGGQLLEKVQQPVEPANSKRATQPMLKGRRWIWLSAVLVAVLAVLVMGYVYILMPYLNEREFESLWAIYMQEQEVDETEEVVYPDGILSQFMSLYRVNSDIAGWLTVDGTAINYPVVLDPSDNYYEGRDFYQKTSTYGVPHLGTGTSLQPGKVSRSLVIYGNNPQNGQMFSDLSEYTNLTYLKQHTTIDFGTIYQENTYKIFAVVMVQDGDTSAGAFDFSQSSFESEDDFLYYVAQLRRRSLFDTPVEIQEGDDLLLLTTPVEYSFSGARILVAARRVRTGEAADNDLSKARVNRTVQMPEVWQELQGVGTTTSSAATTVTTVTTATTTAVPTTTVTEAPTTSTSPATTATTQTTTKPTTTATTVATTTTTVTTTTATTTVTTQQTTAVNEEGDQLVGETTTKPSTTTTSRPSVTRPSDSGENRVDAIEGTVQGTVSEYEFMSYFVLKNTNSAVEDDMQDSDGVMRPKTKEELQRALTYIVKSELGSASTMVASTEAQKAQAVASYSYILWYNSAYQKPYVCKLKPLDLSNKYDKKIYDAVGEVLGVKLLDVGKTSLEDMLLQTAYSAATGGYSASSNKVWSGSLPYLQSVVSPYDNAVSYAKYGGGSFVSTVTLTREELIEKVKAWFAANVQNRYPSYVMPEEQFEAMANESPLQVVSYDGDGTSGTGDGWNYVFYTNFYYVDNRGNKKPLTGFNLRSALGLRSHAFRVTYDAAADTVTLTTQGWGHGVGLSQMGAVGYANEEGWSYVQILRHYYSVSGSSSHQIVMPVW